MQLKSQEHVLLYHVNRYVFMSIGCFIDKAKKGKQL